MFDKEYIFRGRHAEFVKDLTGRFGPDSKFQILSRNLDVYLLAPIIGFLYNRQADIDTSINSEGKNENHAWNYVMIDNKWYGVDTTWDDPVVIGGGSQTYESRYKYFLKTSEVFDKDHIPNGQFTEGGKVFEYPQI